MSERDKARTLKPLARVLVVKIVFTALLCVPLALPPFLMEKLGLPVPQPMVFVRLLGAAYLALIVGYSFGLAQARRGVTPTGVVWMGTVSNGLASALLFVYGFTGAWASWGPFSQAFMWISAVVTLGITLGLLVYRRPL